MLKKIISFILQIWLLIFLTIFTQIGGIIWLLAWLFSKYVVSKLIQSKSYFYYFKLKLSSFLINYLLSTFFLVPHLSTYTGRVALPIFEQHFIQPTTIWTCILNRHYVKPELKKALFRMGDNFNKKYPTSKISYLDANFSFYDGFPLLPHLSHNDGKKIDLSFFYLDKPTQKPSHQKPSFSGYGIYEEPKKGEINQPQICLKQSWYYEIGKYVQIYSDEENYSFDKERTAYLMSVIIKEPSIKKFFLEPHLKNRFKITSSKWRFHGCKASRHDDHVHIQL